ncbi:MAG: hypothetical protein KDH94_05625, partial [Coxiellaceae bacterium]|nr:hypothetical protein [Coxiellaceae bacterium]
QCFRGLEEYRRLGKPTFNGESINPWILAPLKRQELQRASAKAKAAAKPKPNPKPGVKKEAPRKMQP